MRSKGPIRPRVEPFDSTCERHTNIDALLVLTSGGDRRAFSAFYDQMGATVYAKCLNGGFAPLLAAEVTEGVFLQAWRQAPSYDVQVEAAATWLNAIALKAIRMQTEKTLHVAPTSGAPLQLVGVSHE